MNLDLDSDMNRGGFFSGTRSIWFAVMAAALLFSIGGLSGCSSLVGGLRPDLNDQYRYEQSPTTGGRFTEAELLDDGSERSDSERDVAREGRMGGQGSWLQSGEDDRVALRRPMSEQEYDEEGNAKLATRPVMQKKYKQGNRATRADFVDDARDDGSLWTSEGQTNYFLTKNQIKSEGDLVTVLTDDEFMKDVAAELKRTLSPEEREMELEVAQERMRRRTLGLPEDANAGGDQVASAQAAANRAPASADSDPRKAIDIPTVSWNDVDLRKSMEFKTGDPVMMEVIERYPNGNYKLRGLKKVRLHGQTKMVSVIAIAKSSDISNEETINSGKLYEYRLEAVR